MKPVAQIRGHRSQHELAKRRAAENPHFRLGYPARPTGLPRQLRRLWNEYSLGLYQKRLLAETDGELLLRICNAKLVDDNATLAEIAEIFKARTPFPDPFANQEGEPQESTTVSLAEFLQKTGRCRDSFPERLIPTQTLLLDDGGREFDWAADHPLTQARSYSLRVVQREIPACDLHCRACARFLDDLEHGHEHGFFCDPYSAQLIVDWFRDFCKRPPFQWQLFVLVNLFCWKLASGLRRFKECWLWLARQNGKSALSAGIGLYELVADGELHEQVYSAATTRDQAAIIWRDAKEICKVSDELKKRVTIYRGSLSVEDADGVFEPLASETHSLDGLRPGCLCCDEIHEWTDREQWAKLTSGQVSRKQPLTICISTAGGQQRGFGWEKSQLVKQILHGIVKADDIFCCVWQLEDDDDYKNEQLWVKANPSLLDANGLKIEALRRQFAEAEADPSALNGFLRYTCDRWLAFTKVQTTFSIAKVAACRGYDCSPKATGKELYAQFLSNNAGKRCYAGFDYGEINDLAAFVLLFPSVTMPTGEALPSKVLLADFWMPEAFVAQREKEWGVPVSYWIREGWIRTCDGDMNDSCVIKRDILETLQLKQEPSGFSLFNVQSIGYDPWHSRPFMTALAEETATECCEVSQAPSTLTPIAVAFKTAVLAGELWHLGNPVVSWMMTNVILEREGIHDAITPQKPDKYQKIDAVQAALNAWHRMDNALPVPTGKVTFIYADGSAKSSGSEGRLHDLPSLR